MSLRIIILLSFVFFGFTAPTSVESDYIDRYKELAVIEMHRSGIPASITLAQGLHESQSGRSDLATQANNHFGIKCKNYWKGHTYYHKDDDLDKRGKLIKSCFRSYENSIDSYVDHSNFLSQTERYSELFSYPNTDFVSWAHGLKRKGYATDKDYAYKLIAKIEQYKLYQYDFWPYPLRSKLN